MTVSLRRPTRPMTKPTPQPPPSQPCCPRNSRDRDGSNSTIARWIFLAITLATLTRFGTWVLSIFLLGPVLGTASLALMPLLGRTSPLPLEGALALLAVGTAVAIGVGVRLNPGRWQGRARWFGVALMIDVVGYLASIPVALILWGGLTNLVGFGPALAPVFLVNLALLLMGATIARRAKGASREGQEVQS
jgi:hypothetical protein